MRILALSMERGNLLVPGTRDQWKDQTCVKVRQYSQDYKGDLMLQKEATAWSRAVPIEAEFVHAALASKCTITSGSFKAKVQGGSASDWHATTGISCVDLMQASITDCLYALQMQK